jgi:hypothetical protein
MLNKTYLTSDTGPFLDLDISLLRGNFNIRVNEKRDDLSFPIVNFVALKHKKSKI